MLGSNPGLLRLQHWQSDALTNWLDLIYCWIFTLVRFALAVLFFIEDIVDWRVIFFCRFYWRDCERHPGDDEERGDNAWLWSSHGFLPGLSFVENIIKKRFFHLLILFQCFGSGFIVSGSLLISPLLLNIPLSGWANIFQNWRAAFLKLDKNGQNMSYF